MLKSLREHFPLKCFYFCKKDAFNNKIIYQICMSSWEVHQEAYSIRFYEKHYVEQKRRYHNNTVVQITSLSVFIISNNDILFLVRKKGFCVQVYQDKLPCRLKDIWLIFNIQSLASEFECHKASCKNSFGASCNCDSAIDKIDNYHN